MLPDLLHFKSLHQTRKLIIESKEWEYIIAGNRGPVILLLPGGASTAESAFPLIQLLEVDHTVITPSYQLSEDMSGLCKGIAAILANENIEKLHLVGSSYGGLVAQYFVRMYPEKVKSLVLAHTFIVRQRVAGKLQVASRLLAVIPDSILNFLLTLRINKLLLNKLSSINHPEKDFWKAYFKNLIRSGLFLQILFHQNKSLIECTRLPGFQPTDLDPEIIKVLIIESADDNALSRKDRAALRSTYPYAEVFSFKDAGHMSFITERDAVVKLLARFWQ